MLEAGTGLFRRRGKSAGKSCGINEIRLEVVFRDIPGKLVQWRRQSQRLRRLGYLRRAPVKPPGDGIAPVPAAPPRLRLLPAGGLTFWSVAGPLPDSCSRTRPEPPAADCAWSLPGLWHRDDSSSSSRGDRQVRSECLGHSWRVRVGRFWRAPKSTGRPRPLASAWRLPL